MDEKKSAVSREKKGNPKKTILYLSSVVLVAVVSVLITLAYLGTNSDKKVNTFLGSDGIQLEVNEDAWTTTPPDGPSEEERAKDYTPGQTYNKDPKLINTSTNKNYEEWVAIKVHFEIGTKTGTGNNATVTTGTAATNKGITSNWGTFSGIADIISDNTTFKDAGKTIIDTGTGFNTGTAANKWTLIATSSQSCITKDASTEVISLGTYPAKIEDTDDWAIFIYNSKLPSQDNSVTPKVSGTTSNIFNQIKMKEQSVFADKGWISNVNGSSTYNLPSFNINILGAAIKVEAANNTSTGNLFTSCKDQVNVLNELYNLLKDK